MRIVALDAIPDCRRMHRLGRICFLLVVAAQAERLRSRGRQLDAGDILGDADFVAAQAARRDRRVHCLTFGFLCVALQALRGIDVLIQRNRMRLPEGGERCHGQQKKGYEEWGENSLAWRTISRRAPCDFWEHAT